MATAVHTNAVIPAGRWRVDCERSEVAFSVKHLLVVPVHGRFNDFEGSLTVEPDGDTVASGSVLAASVDTGDAKRDERLRDPDFLDAERCPRIRLSGGRMKPEGGLRLRVTGDLEVRGIRREVELTAHAGEITPELAELTLGGRLSRGAYGIESEQLLDAGISDRVEIALKLSLLRVD